MAEHAPGPWRAVEIMIDGNGDCTNWSVFENGGLGAYVATVQPAPVGLALKLDVVAANARLIAAAPEMYEALKAIAADAKWQNAPYEILRAASAALAKTEA